jgi:hypothetical protein
VSDDEERRIKARHDVTQFYQRRKIVSRRELSRGDMSIECDPSPTREEEDSEDDDVEDETYVPSPRAHPHGQGKGLASASGSGTARDEIEEEVDGGDCDDEEEEEIFDVQEINPPNYVHMGTPIFWLPQNPNWREKISYKGKTDLVREKRKENSKLIEKEPGIDYRFHTMF